MCVSAGVTFHWGGGLYLDISSRDWVETQAEVLGLDIKKFRNRDGDVNYSITISYEYIVAGKRYQNNMFGFLNYAVSSDSFFYKEARKIESRQPKSKNIQVYVNMDKPQQSVVLRYISTIFYSVYIMFSLVFLIFSLACWYLLYRSFKRVGD